MIKLGTLGQIPMCLQKGQKVAHVALDHILLRPEEFPAYLTQQLGFRLLKSNVNPSKQAGFGRPIYWFKKI
jgi:hypothetical protein